MQEANDKNNNNFQSEKCFENTLNLNIFCTKLAQYAINCVLGFHEPNEKTPLHLPS